VLVAGAVQQVLDLVLPLPSSPPGQDEVEEKEQEEKEKKKKEQLDVMPVQGSGG